MIIRSTAHRGDFRNAGLDLNFKSFEGYLRVFIAQLAKLKGTALIRLVFSLRDKTMSTSIKSSPQISSLRKAAAKLSQDSDLMGDVKLSKLAAALESGLSPTVMTRKMATFQALDNVAPVGARLPLPPLPPVLNTSIIGTAHDDILIGTPFNDVIKGLGGNDTILALGGNDKIYGGAGQDLIIAGAGNDRVYGNSGADQVFGGLGNDFIRGGSGIDVILGEEGNDRIYGDNGSDRLFAGAGKDYVFGGNGNDIIDGADGDDSLYGQHGNDRFFGGAGNDRIFGGNGNDNLNGNEGNDRLSGGNGKDFLFGATGNDRLFGGNGNDELRGGSGLDYLNGGRGNDRLIAADANGGFGPADSSDRLVGGGGHDTFVLGDSSRVFYLGSAAARILDFNRHQDKIELKGAASDYLLQYVGGSSQQTNIFYVAGLGADKIATVNNAALGLSLHSDVFEYV